MLPLFSRRFPLNSLRLPVIYFRPLNTPLPLRVVPFPITSMHSPANRRSFSPYYNIEHASPMVTFDDTNAFAAPDSDQMLFGPVDFEDYISSSSPPQFSWDPLNTFDHDVKPMFDFSAASPDYGCDVSQSSPTDSGYYDSMDSYTMRATKNSPPPDTHQFLSNWINDPELSMSSPSSPIPIPSSSSSHIPQSPTFTTFAHPIPFPLVSTLSPTEYAALHPLPRSMSPSGPSEGHYSPQRQQIESISPHDTSLHTPSWASQLWDDSHSVRSPTLPRHPVRHSLLRDTTVRQRAPSYRGSVSSGHIFQSSSAPSFAPRAPSMSRSYSRRAESVSVTDDHDATVRRKKRSLPSDDPKTTVKTIDHRKFSYISTYCHFI